MEQTTNGGSDGGEAKTRNETSNLRSKADEENTTVPAGDSKETLNRGAEVGDKVANRRSLIDDAADRAGETGQTEAAEQAGDFRGELDEEVLSVLADDAEEVLDARSRVLEEVAGSLGVTALDVVAENVDNLADGGGEAGEETGEEATDLRGEFDEESAAIVAEDGEEVLHRQAEVLEEITDIAGLLDDAANGDAELGKAESAQQSDDGRVKLDKELLSVLADDGQGAVHAWSEIREEPAVGRRGRGRSPGESVGNGSDDVRDDAAVVGGGGDGGGRQSSESSDESGLHFDDGRMKDE